MKIKAQEIASYQQSLAQGFAPYALCLDTVFVYAKAMSDAKETEKEYYEWCNWLLKNVSSYVQERRSILKQQQVEFPDEDTLISKAIQIGMIKDAKDAPEGMREFIHYCQVSLDLFDQSDQQKFAKEFCSKLGLKVKTDTDVYWKTLAANIQKYEHGDFPKKRNHVSESINILAAKVRKAKTNVIESSPDRYISYYLPYMLEKSKPFYAGATELIMVNLFAKRQNSSMSVIKGQANSKLLLVLQGGHYLICENSGKVLWDFAGSHDTATNTYKEAFNFDENKVNEEWVETEIRDAGSGHKWEYLKFDT